jgi:hypothetical protein
LGKQVFFIGRLDLLKNETRIEMRYSVTTLDDVGKFANVVRKQGMPSLKSDVVPFVTTTRTGLAFASTAR